MNKSKELRNTTKIVHIILEKDEYARNSDSYLYLKVCEKIGNDRGINLSTMSVPHFFLHLKAYNLPGFETVRRTRQKLQAEHPELSGDSNVEAQRILNEESFKEYARTSV